MNLFTLSPRSLGVFRILIAFVLLLDSLNKALWARHFYSDWGLLPRTVWISDFMPAWKMSIHLASGETWFQVVLILIQALAAIAMMIGWKTRTAQFIAFILLCSLQSRNNVILSAADDLLRLSLFWSLFLPLNKAFAVEKDATATSTDSITSFASIAFITQLFLMYFITGLLKHHPIWFEEGSAIYYALNIDMYMKPAGIFLRDYIGLTQVFTWLTLALEIFGPFLIFAGRKLRTTAVILFIGFHLGLALTMTLGLFPWIAIIYWIALIPDSVWSTPFGSKISMTFDKVFFQIKSLLSKIDLKEPKSTAYKFTRPGQYFLIMCFGLMIWINLASLSKKVPFPEAVKATTYYLYLNQHWDMFAPYPIKNDGWFVIEGRFKDGTAKELQTNEDVTFAKPALSSSLYANSEWRKWMLNVWDRGNRKILLPYARYLCRKFSASETGDSDLATIKINFMKETTPPMGKSFTPVEQKVLWEHDCFAQ